jgi:hypothetical protein
MAAIAQPIARAACDRAPLGQVRVRDTLREMGKAIGLGGEAADPAKQAAMRILSERLDAAIRASTDRLIAIHHLDGRAADEVMARLASNVTTDSPVDERKAAIIGGFVSGALTGLAADLASGGLTFGAGLLAGGVVGAFGAAGLARGFNVVRGKTESTVRWSDEFVAALAPAAVLRYLAVAHYGRGRGEWSASEYPPFWRATVATAIAHHDLVPTVALRNGDELRPLRANARQTILERYDLERVCLPAQLALLGSLQRQRADARPAADVEHLPGDEVRVPVGEEQHRARHVVGLA